MAIGGRATGGGGHAWMHIADLERTVMEFLGIRPVDPKVETQA